MLDKQNYFCLARSKEATISALAASALSQPSTFNPLAFFQIFVVLEEVSDLGFQQFRQVVHIFDVIVFFAQLGVRYRNQLGIFTGFVGHFQYANRTAADN